MTERLLREWDYWLPGHPGMGNYLSDRKERAMATGQIEADVMFHDPLTDLAAIEARWNAASAGRWHADGVLVHDETGATLFQTTPPNAVFCAMAKSQDVPRLLGEVRRLHVTCMKSQDEFENQLRLYAESIEALEAEITTLRGHSVKKLSGAQVQIDTQEAIEYEPGSSLDNVIRGAKGDFSQK